MAYGGTSDFTTENLQSKYQAVAQGLLNKTYDPAAAGTAADPYLKYLSTTNSNMKATQYLLDSRNWSTYVNEYADWAIGGPTLELFVNSYNASSLSTTDVEITIPTGNGYLLKDTFLTAGSVPQDTYLNHYTSTNNSPFGYWLACPSSFGRSHVHYVGCQSLNVAVSIFNYDFAFRPLVCLDSNVKLTLNETTGEYDLLWATGD